MRSLFVFLLLLTGLGFCLTESTELSPEKEDNTLLLLSALFVILVLIVGGYLILKRKRKRKSMGLEPRGPSTVEERLAAKVASEVKGPEPLEKSKKKKAKKRPRKRKKKQFR